MDEVHPFSDTTGVDVLLRESERMLSRDLEAVGPKNASRIWGFMSKFLLLDQFMKTMGLADCYPGTPVPRKICSMDYFGTASKVTVFTTIHHNFYSFSSDGRRT